ncbi:hypothetical protein [Streptomyces sp. NPDC094472]|uniref:hypothetical protein n=1 Tax=Streptomyces sp. NPDC094472 TaxID=3155080 RepID=UPI0033194E01
MHPHPAVLGIQVPDANVPDLAAVAPGQGESGSGTVAAGPGDERGMVTQVDGLVLGQRPYIADSPSGQVDVLGRVGIAQWQCEAEVLPYAQQNGYDEVWCDGPVGRAEYTVWVR